MDAFTCNAENDTRQPHLLPADPLRDAQLHNFALRLDLRRVRRDLVGSHKIATVDRLLDVNAAIARSLEWLNSGSRTTEDGLEELSQLAAEQRAVPDAIEVLAQ